MKQPPPNLGKVHVVDGDNGTKLIKIDNPSHGPMPADQVMIRAAWEIYIAAPHSTIKVAALLKQIEAAAKQPKR
jgi:hypothetical protein